MDKNEIRIARQARQTKKNNELYTIHLRIFTYWGGRKEEFVLSTRQTVPIKQWDDVKKQARGNSDEARRINKTTDQYIQGIRELFDSYRLTAQTLSASGFKTLVSQELFGVNKNHIDDRLYLPDLFDRYVDLNRKNLSKRRVDMFGFVKDYVVEYTKQKYSTEQFDYNLLNREWYKGFSNFMLDQYNYEHSTLRGYLKVLRAVVNEAISNGLIDFMPFKNCPLPKCNKKRRYLNQNEFNAILNFKSDNKHTQLVADCFAFVCYTGLSHSDLRALTYNMIRKQDDCVFIEKPRGKTDVYSTIPLLDDAIAIIEKYEDDPRRKGTYILPVPYINSYNSHLKTIAAACGIQINLTSHMARHTLGTTVWMGEGGTTDILQEVLGHTNNETTRQYGEVTVATVINAARKIFPDKMKTGEAFYNKLFLNPNINGRV